MHHISQMQCDTVCRSLEIIVPLEHWAYLVIRASDHNTWPCSTHVQTSGWPTVCLSKYVAKYFHVLLGHEYLHPANAIWNWSFNIASLENWAYPATTCIWVGYVAFDGNYDCITFTLSLWPCSKRGIWMANCVRVFGNGVARLHGCETFLPIDNHDCATWDICSLETSIWITNYIFT